MNRRELIKTGLLLVGMTTLCGCKNENMFSSKSTEQDNVYCFSTPMPFNFDAIDKLAELNKKYKKSKIETLYNNIPLPLAKKFNGWFQANIAVNNEIDSYQKFFEYTKYAKEKGFKIRYLMDSPKVLSLEDFQKQKNDFYNLTDMLYENGIYSIEYANIQVAHALRESRYLFNLISSTYADYHNVQQYINLTNEYPGTHDINLSIDEIHNFPLLKSLKNALKGTKIELTVNDICFKGCPARISHSGEMKFKKFDCDKIMNKMGNIYSFLKAGIIYPWDLEHYSAIGINNFKFISSLKDLQMNNSNDTEPLNMYLSIIENGIDKISAKDFFNIFKKNLTTKDIMLSEVKPYLLDIQHFIEFGDRCAASCESSCNYCKNLANKLKNILV